MKMRNSILRCIATACLVASFFALSYAQYSNHESTGFGPTAFNLKKGENRITSTLLVFNSYTRGIGSNLSFNVGGAVGGGITRLKYTQTIFDYLHIGVSPFLWFDFGDNDGYFHPGLSGMVTVGNQDYFLNFSYSKSFDLENTLERSTGNKTLNITDSQTYYSISASLRLGKKTTLINEYFIELDTNPNSYTSYQVRIALKSNHVIQCGFVFAAEEYYDEYDTEPSTSFLLLPAVSYSYFWGIKSKHTKENKL